MFQQYDVNEFQRVGSKVKYLQAELRKHDTSLNAGDTGKSDRSTHYPHLCLCVDMVINYQSINQSINQSNHSICTLNYGNQYYCMLFNHH